MQSFASIFVVNAGIVTMAKPICIQRRSLEYVFFSSLTASPLNANARFLCLSAFLHKVFNKQLHKTRKVPVR